MATRPVRNRGNPPTGIFSRLLEALRPLPVRAQEIVADPSAPSPSANLAAGMAAQLRDNERIWAGFRDLELRMLAAESLHDIFHMYWMY